jgi:hypothetical protein
MRDGEQLAEVLREVTSFWSGYQRRRRGAQARGDGGSNLERDRVCQKVEAAGTGTAR